MKIRFLAENRTEATLRKLISESQTIDIAVAWAGENTIVDMLMNEKSKLRHVVIGTHLYQTNPKVLRSFQDETAVKCKPPNGRLFHPKLYIFISPEQISFIVGSHNLTNGAFGGNNIESSVIVEGLKSDKTIKDALKFVKTEWNKAVEIDDDFLFSYENQYKAKKSKRDDLRKFLMLKKPKKVKGVNVSAPYDLEWDDFVYKVKGDAHHALTERLGSGLIDHSQKMTVAAMQMADMKVWAQRS